MPLFGVDVSHHQGTAIDWGKVRASGIDFMLARASLATTPDATYRDNVRKARLAGIPVVGAYHFLYPASAVTPVKQARLFVERIEDADGLLTMLDIEKDRSPTTGEIFTATISDVRAFAAEFARLTDDHTLIMYAPGWYWTGHIGNPAAADLGPLCASRYVPVEKDDRGHPIRMTPIEAYAKVPPKYWKAKHGGWSKATFLQFTSTGKVGGHGGRIDVDAFDGSMQKLLTLTGPAGQPQSILVPPLSTTPAPTTGMRAGRRTTVPTGAAPARATPARTTPLGAAPSTATPAPTKLFHVVVHGETLSGIAARNGFRPTPNLPAFRVMINAFSENARYRANPKLIHAGDGVRVR